MGFWGRTSSFLAGQGAGLAYFCFRAPTTLLGRYFRCWPPKAEVAASSPSHAPRRADNIDLPGKERWDLCYKTSFSEISGLGANATSGPQGGDVAHADGKCSPTAGGVRGQLSC